MKGQEDEEVIGATGASAWTKGVGDISFGLVGQVT